MTIARQTQKTALIIQLGLLVSFIYILCLSYAHADSSISLSSEAKNNFGSGTPQQGIVNPNPLTAKAGTRQSHLPTGANTQLSIHLELAPDHHAYLDQFHLKAPKELNMGEFKIDPVITFYDKFSDKKRQGIKGSAVLTAVIEAPLETPANTYDFNFELTYQACTEKYCLLPKKIDIPLVLNIVEANHLQEGQNKVQIEESESPFTLAQKRGLFYVLIFVFIAGILTSFTPCIFPMIPITLAVIGSQGEKSSKKRGFLISLFYVHGIALTYSILGLIAASTGSLFGSFLGSKWFAFALSLLFVVLALSMFGLFEIRMPHALAQKLTGKSQKGSLGGAFLSGLAAGIVASPCVGPVLISVLTFVAQTQDLVLGFFLLFTYALGFGLLFLILGTFSHLIHRLPKAGPWMNFTKFVFGNSMLGLALYYIAPVISQQAFDGLLGASLILVSSFFGAFARVEAKHPLYHLKKGVLLFLFVLGVAYGLKATFPQGFVGSSNTAPSAPHKPDWQTYSEDKIIEAKTKGLGVIIDFYADWCLSCKELEKLTFSKEKVLQVGREFMWLKYDATEVGPEFRALQEKYNILGLPHIIFYDNRGNLRHDLTLTGFEKEDDFILRMKKAL